MKKAQGRASGRLAMTVTLIICGIFVIAMLFVFFLGDMIAGRIKLSQSIGELEESKLIVISDPLHKGDILTTGGEVTLTGEEAEKFGERLAYVAEKVSYQKVLKGDTGFWDVRLSFSENGEAYSIYMKEDSIYVAKGSKGYLFDIREQREQEYKALYEDIENLIASSSK